MNKKETIKHFYEVIVSNNLLNELPQYVSENCVLIDGERKIPLGLEGMKEHLTAVKQTYPDYTMRILRQYKDGDYIISEFVMEGTHEGEWIGIKPTHKRLSFTGIDIDKIVDGKIVEHGGAVNTFETLYEHNMIDKNGHFGIEAPLHWACKSGNLDIVRYLCEKQKVDKESKTSESETPDQNSAGITSKNSGHILLM